MGECYFNEYNVVLNMHKIFVKVAVFLVTNFNASNVGNEVLKAFSYFQEF